MGKKLTFSMLTDLEKTEYISQVNKFHHDWAEKADRASARSNSLLRTVLTGGKNIVLGGAQEAYHVFKHMYQSDKMVNFLERMRKKYGCDSVDEDSFPKLPVSSTDVSYKDIILHTIGLKGNDIVTCPKCCEVMEFYISRPKSSPYNCPKCSTRLW